jgi:hypothetical protein
MATDTIHNLILKSATSSSPLLKAIYRDPQITAYNRLEPRARTEDFTRSLRAEIRDPLWMLTRQWQMGELEAEDTGSPVDARLVTAQTRVDRVALGGKGGQSYHEELPLETAVERETILSSPSTDPSTKQKIALPHALKVQVAQYFLKLHPPALRATYHAKYRAAFPFATTDDALFRGQTDGLNVYTATKSRDFDGQALIEAIRALTFETQATIPPGDPDGIAGLAQLLLAWFGRQYSQPTKDENAWDPHRLTYALQAAAPRPDGSQWVLDASHYHEGRLDWYSFDVDPEAAPLATDDPAPAVPPASEPAISFLPVAASFKGMPNPRFWEMENRQINLGQLNAKTTDSLLLLFAELGLIYGNDWFVIPYAMKVNTLCEIRGLVVTDVFGERTLIRAADEGADNDWQRWSMFNLSNKNEIGRYNRQFFLPAALANTLESEPIEQVNYLRDEMANMVWAVEEIIPDATSKGINGYDAAEKIGIEPPPIAASTASIRYVLGTTVPENWIPFLPVHQAGSNQSIQFRRAVMPKLGVPPKDVIKPKGVLLAEVKSPYYINEEEIPSAGTLVRRSYQRARWYNGRTYVWIGRCRETGRGEGSSELRFDQIEPVK